VTLLINYKFYEPKQFQSGGLLRQVFIFVVLFKISDYYNLEVDAAKLEAREKQLDFGRNTPGYKNFLHFVPIHQWTRCDPLPPNIHQVCSKVY
jgi:hypothetical protein